jgi:preprotein translocase subunit SecY
VDPKDIADNLLKNGDCIENVRPGKQTKNYLNMVLLVLTVISNIIIMIIMVTPLLVGFSFKGKTDLFSTPLTFTILTSIVLNVKEEFETRLLGNVYEKRLIHLERGEK